MKTIKEILKNDKLLILTIILLIVMSAYWKIANGNLKAELEEANKPSLVEVKKTKLKEMESGWRTNEKAKQDCEVVIQKWNEEKPAIEQGIDELRLDIINL